MSWTGDEFFFKTEKQAQSGNQLTRKRFVVTWYCLSPWIFVFVHNVPVELNMTQHSASFTLRRTHRLSAAWVFDTTILEVKCCSIISKKLVWDRR